MATSPRRKSTTPSAICGNTSSRLPTHTCLASGPAFRCASIASRIPTRTTSGINICAAKGRPQWFTAKPQPSTPASSLQACWNRKAASTRPSASTPYTLGSTTSTSYTKSMPPGAISSTMSPSGPKVPKSTSCFANGKTKVCSRLATITTRTRWTKSAHAWPTGCATKATTTPRPTSSPTSSTQPSKTTS